MRLRTHASFFEFPGIVEKYFLLLSCPPRRTKRDTQRVKDQAKDSSNATASTRSGVVKPSVYVA